MEHVLITPWEPLHPECEWDWVYLTGRRRSLPYARLALGDVVYVKESGGDYVESGVVSFVRSFEFSTMRDLTVRLQEVCEDFVPDHPYYRLTAEKLRAAREEGKWTLYCSALRLAERLPMTAEDAVPLAQSHHPWVILDTDEKRRAWLGGYVRPAGPKTGRRRR